MGWAEAEFAEVEKAAAEAAIQAESAGEVERATEAKVLFRIREAATAREAARRRGEPLQRPRRMPKSGRRRRPRGLLLSPRWPRLAEPPVRRTLSLRS